MGWGSSSGGGGQSGKIEYASYLQNVHDNWLTGEANADHDIMATSINDMMNAAVLGDNPYTSPTNSNPDAVNGLIDRMEVEIAKIISNTATLDEENNWNSFNDSITTQITATIINNNSDAAYVDNSDTDDATVNAEIAANDAIIDSRITTTILPRFQAGMQDINAVVSSAFVVGQSNIESEGQLDKDKFAADIRLKSYMLGFEGILKRDLQINEINESRSKRVTARDIQHNEMIMTGTKDVIGMLINRLEFIKIGTHYRIEGDRIIFLMRQEYEERVVDWDEKDEVWDMSMYQYGVNVMASISGAAATARGGAPSTMQKALGGALSGIAVGAAVNGPPGAIVGGVIGLASSFL